MSTEPRGVPPTYVRLEVLERGEWKVSHHGIRLLDPARYVERLAERGKTARAVSLDSDQVWGPNVDAATSEICPVCEEAHPGPYTGECLL